MKIIMKTTILVVVCAVLASGCSRADDGQAAESVTVDAVLSESAAPAPARSEPAPAETAAPETAVEEDATEDASAEDAVAENAAELEAAGGEPQTASAVSAAAPKYAIGDTGPGGGIVFANAGGRYKEITIPGREDTFTARRKREADHYRPLGEQLEADRKVIEEARAEKDQAKVEQLVDESNARIENYPPPPPFLPAGWRQATMPELIVVYDVLKKTGKVDFGNALYSSSSHLDYRGAGTKYSRNAVSYIPGAVGGESPSGFPAYRIILAGGGAGSFHAMDMGNGAITVIGDDYLSAEDYTAMKVDYKNFTVAGIRIPYVREF
jgi:hypothetical protein